MNTSISLGHDSMFQVFASNQINNNLTNYPIVPGVLSVSMPPTEYITTTISTEPPKYRVRPLSPPPSTGPWLTLAERTCSG